MSVYILPVYLVCGGPKTYKFRTEAQALDFAYWLIGDQGLQDIETFRGYVECPIIDGVVFVPADIL